MKNTYLNRMLMWNNLLQFLAEKDSVWSLYIPFSSAVSVLGHCSTAADAVLAAQTASVKEASRERDVLLEIVLKNVRAIANSTVAFASATGDSNLLRQAKFRGYRFAKAKQQVRVTMLRALLEAARPHSADLLAYGIAADVWGSAEGALQAYAEAVNAPQRFIRNRAAATEAAKRIFRTAGAAILEMDNLIHIFEDPAPDFADGYRSHRKIAHRIGRHKAGEDSDAKAA